uniref:(northern house mosquito) hypothetical protein n=1 Tax=Culex pipiens TaxID=7175 RepID=A0A8D8FNX9_CULPI
MAQVAPFVLLPEDEKLAEAAVLLLNVRPRVLAVAQDGHVLVAGEQLEDQEDALDVERLLLQVVAFERFQEVEHLRQAVQPVHPGGLVGPGVVPDAGEDHRD